MSLEWLESDLIPVDLSSPPHGWGWDPTQNLNPSKEGLCVTLLSISDNIFRSMSMIICSRMWLLLVNFNHFSSNPINSSTHHFQTLCRREDYTKSDVNTKQMQGHTLRYDGSRQFTQLWRRMPNHEHKKEEVDGGNPSTQ